MTNFLANKYFQISLRIILGVIFIYASVGKLFRPEDFAKAILRYEFLPVYFVNIMAIVMPWVEFFTGVLLITGIFKKASSLLAGISLIVFLTALISAFARGLDISCGCFSLEETSTKGDIIYRIVQDVFMLAGAVIVYKFSDTKKAQETVTAEEIN
ncbi:MAG: DoxX family membrane protein [Ignavibacteriae bacterium]|nr:DoxX family membrane protein [Ignavibacteriota bacterium]